MINHNASRNNRKVLVVKIPKSKEMSFETTLSKLFIEYPMVKFIGWIDRVEAIQIHGENYKVYCYPISGMIELKQSFAEPSIFKITAKKKLYDKYTNFLHKCSINLETDKILIT